MNDRDLSEYDARLRAALKHLYRMRHMYRQHPALPGGEARVLPTLEARLAAITAERRRVRRGIKLIRQGSPPPDAAKSTPPTPAPLAAREVARLIRATRRRVLREMQAEASEASEASEAEVSKAERPRRAAHPQKRRPN